MKTSALLFLILFISACASEESEPKWLQNAPETTQSGAQADAVPAMLPDYGSNNTHSGDHGAGHR